MEQLKFKGVFKLLFIFSIVAVKEICCGPIGDIDIQENSVRTGRKVVIPWFDIVFKPNLEIEYTTKKEESQFLRDSARDQKSFEDFGSDDQGFDSNEYYGGDNEFFTFDPISHPSNNKNYGFNNYYNQGPYGSEFGQNLGYHHDFDHHHNFGPKFGFPHHHHGLHHSHGPECIFQFGDGRRHPRPGPPPPPPGPPPPPPGPPPTVAPTTTNAPTAAPTAAPSSTSTTPTTVSIDPRASTSASLVSTEIPNIDIRFNNRDTRDVRNQGDIHSFS